MKIGCFEIICLDCGSRNLKVNEYMHTIKIKCNCCNKEYSYFWDNGEYVVGKGD
jgi:hypothetical protein